MKHIVLCRETYCTNCHNAETGEVSFVSFKFAFIFNLTGINFVHCDAPSQICGKVSFFSC
jgi:hypothetical protein